MVTYLRSSCRALVADASPLATRTLAMLSDVTSGGPGSTPSAALMSQTCSITSVTRIVPTPSLPIELDDITESALVLVHVAAPAADVMYPYTSAAFFVVGVNLPHVASEPASVRIGAPSLSVMPLGPPCPRSCVPSTLRSELVTFIAGLSTLVALLPPHVMPSRRCGHAFATTDLSVCMSPSCGLEVVRDNLFIVNS
jgi:hypothetical protein